MWIDRSGFGARGIATLPAAAALLALASACVPPELTEGAPDGGGAATTSTTSPGGAPASGGSESSGGPGGSGGGTVGSGGSGGGATTTSTITATTGGGGATASCTNGGTCVPVSPAGWMYVRSYTSNFGSPSPGACPGGEDPGVYYSEPNPSACKSCGCGWFGTKCSEPELSCYYGSSTCAGSPTFSMVPSSSACVGPTQIPLNPANNSSCKITKPPQVLDPGTCNPGVPGQTNPQPWGKATYVCAATLTSSSDCADGICVVDGSGVYSGPVCVMKSGKLPCPAPWLPTPLVHAGVTDSRSCTACSCGTPTTTCGPSSYNVFPEDACTGGGTFLLEGTCANTGALFSDATRSIKPTTVVGSSTGNCSGGSPLGEVTGVGPQTICCL